jgi:hypothetical protein
MMHSICIQVSISFSRGMVSNNAAIDITLFTWLVANQPAIFFSYIKSALAISHQSASSAFSHNKSTPATSHSPINRVGLLLASCYCN